MQPHHTLIHAKNDKIFSRSSLEQRNYLVFITKGNETCLHCKKTMLLLIPNKSNFNRWKLHSEWSQQICFIYCLQQLMQVIIEQIRRLGLDKLFNLWMDEVRESALKCVLGRFRDGHVQHGQKIRSVLLQLILERRIYILNWQFLPVK